MPILNSKIGVGHTTHTRKTPFFRHFKYHLNYLFIDLDEVGLLDNLPLFKWNSSFFFSLKPQSYLEPGHRNLNNKLSQFIQKNAPNLVYSKAYLLTAPTFFGINFNPVSFFYLCNDDHNIVSIIAEVHNTFKEKHLYLLTEPQINGNHITFEHIKEFHVSPFFKVEGKYCFLFSKKIDMIDISINYHKGKKQMFNANLKLQLKPLEQKGFFKMSYNFFQTAITTFPRILFQAAKLKLIHQLPHFKNIGMSSKQSFSRKPPTFISKFSIRLFNNYLKKINHGHLIIKCPNGESMSYGDDKTSPMATIIVDDYRFFTDMVLKSDIGLADAYIKQFWRTECLESVFDLFLANESLLKTSNMFIKIRKSINFLQRKLNKNNISKAKKNIFEHYDLGNDFFKLFLDDQRVYSSAIFTDPSEPIETAQIHKIKQAITLADIQPHHHLLEIGSGWGALAIEAATSIGCHVTTVTISEEQYNYVKQEINRRHLDAKIEVKLMDYRLLSGKYDRIISIEMLEAVGHEYLKTYFNKCNDLLNRHGKAMFQCIMIPNDRYNEYRKSMDFIQKYIFPGGHLPSIEVIKSAISTANFKWVSSDKITEHYVQTLRIWHDNFRSKKSDVIAMGFSQAFFQTWLYYFKYCISGFKSNFIENYQFVIEKCQS